MEKHVSIISLTEKQANALIAKHYSIHLDFNCPVEDRHEMNKDFVKSEIYTQQRANLFNILTACIGTEYKIERHFGRDRSVGYTTIKSVQGNDHIIGYRDKSCEHVEIALCFLRAKSYRWFRSKYPV